MMECFQVIFYQKRDAASNIAQLENKIEPVFRQADIH